MSLAFLLAADAGDIAILNQLLSIASVGPPGALEKVVNYQHDGPCSSGYNTGVTALMLASRSGHLPVVKALLEAHANPNILDAEQWNALHYAAFSGHAEICKLLLKAKCNSKLITKYDRATPLGFAEHRRFTKAVAVLSPPASKFSSLGRVEEKGWTIKERHAALQKCIDKLQLATPTPFGTIPFLFRYELSMGGYRALEEYLSQAKDVIFDGGRLVLEALDNMVDDEDASSEQMRGGPEESSSITIADDGGMTQPSTTVSPTSSNVTATPAVATKYLKITEDDDIHAQCVKRSKKRVVLIIHTDFEEHCKFAEKMRTLPDEGTVVRMSSVNGLEHVIVVIPTNA